MYIYIYIHCILYIYIYYVFIVYLYTTVMYNIPSQIVSNAFFWRLAPVVTGSAVSQILDLDKGIRFGKSILDHEVNLGNL